MTNLEKALEQIKTAIQATDRARELCEVALRRDADKPLGAIAATYVSRVRDAREALEVVELMVELSVEREASQTSD